MSGDAGLASELKARTGWQVDLLPDPSELGTAEAAERLFTAGHGIVREVLQTRTALPANLLVVAPGTIPAAVTAPLAGLLKTAAMEKPEDCRARHCSGRRLERGPARRDWRH
ncbi:hypothetical protein QW131_17355 [Roseibium salinum]|nr:hypothetical protein [Roseibium salinum]